MASWPWLRTAIARRLLYFIALTALLSSAFAQDTTLLPSSASDKFPACALSCPRLQQAQANCVPPAAPKTGKTTYVSCFCQSSLITSLHSSANGICDSCTNPSDLSKLEKWYNDFCSSGGEVHTSSTQTATATSATGTSTATDGTSTDQSSSSSGSSSTSSGHRSWWSTHYQWVIMLIVLAIGFTVIGVGGTYLKRRHDAKNPGLYHGGDGSGSTGVLFSRAAVASPATDASGAKQAFATPARVDQFGSDSVPSDVMAPMAMGSRTRTPSRLQRSPPSTESGDLEVREVPR